MRQSIVASAWLVGSSISLCVAPASAQQTFADAVVEQLRCEVPPSPLPILEALAGAGLIDPRANLGFDSLSCFLIEGGIDVAGLRLNSVCAHEERDEIRAQRPDLLYRGPGTSPGQTLSFGTSANEPAVALWYAEVIGRRHLSEAISSEYTSVGDRTEITCSSWFAG